MCFASSVRLAYYIYIYIYIYIYVKYSPIDCRTRDIDNNTWARVDMEFLCELNTRREIPYQATMYYFVYHINTVALY